MRYRLYQIIERAGEGDRPSRIYDIFIVCVALLSLVPLMFKEWNDVLQWWDLITVYLLLFDYVLRWLTNDFRSGKKGWRAAIAYPFRPMAIIDLLAILPSLGLIPAGFAVLRVLRVVRLLRYSRSLTLVTNVFAAEKDTLLSVLVLAIGYIFVSALVMFVYEPDTFDTFFGALYWATTALTTVGYGDVYPTSDVGKLISMVSSLFGVAIIALPAGIVTGGFLEELKKSNEDPTYYATADDVAYEVHGWQGEGIGAFCRSHRRFIRYAVIMAVCVIVNTVFYELASAMGWPVWLDSTGTALAAFILGPAPGVIVALLNNLYLCVTHYSASNIVYFATSALVALTFACLLRPLCGTWRQRPFHAMATVLVALVLLVVGVSALDTLFLSWLQGGISTDAEELALIGSVYSFGIHDRLLADFGGLLLIRLFDTAAMVVIVTVVWNLIPRRYRAAKK